MGPDVFSSSLSEWFMDRTSTACDGTSIVFEYVQPQSFAGPIDGNKISLSTYTILCRVEYKHKKTEYHAFVFEADYVNKEKKVKGAIIDNQSHNMLTGIQESDVRDVDSMRRVCLKLYGGVTKFTHCWEVIKECNI